MRHAGCSADIPSDKELKYGAVAPALPNELPAVWREYESFLGPVPNQGGVPECVCEAAAGMMRVLTAMSGWDVTFDSDELFARCRDMDEGTGVRPSVAFGILRTEGMSASDGRRYRIGWSARIQCLEDLKKALVLHGPVLIGLDLSALGLETLGPDAVVPLAVIFDFRHAMLAVGFDDSRQALRMRNSWGPGWGDEGYCWLPYDYLTRCDQAFDAWTSNGEVQL